MDRGGPYGSRESISTRGHDVLRENDSPDCVGFVFVWWRWCLQWKQREARITSVVKSLLFLCWGVFYRVFMRKGRHLLITVLSMDAARRQLLETPETPLFVLSIGWWLFSDLWPCFWFREGMVVVGMLFYPCFWPSWLSTGCLYWVTLLWWMELIVSSAPTSHFFIMVQCFPGKLWPVFLIESILHIIITQQPPFGSIVVDGTDLQ